MKQPFVPCHITPMKGRHLGNLLNKDEQCRLAENCGLTIPQSIIYNRNEDFPTVSYPILMKPANSNTGEKSDIHICYCQKDVNKALSATSTCNQFIIQKFIEKEYEINLIGVSTVNGVYIPGGIRKIRHYPTIYMPMLFWSIPIGRKLECRCSFDIKINATCRVSWTIQCGIIT